MTSETAMQCDPVSDVQTPVVEPSPFIVEFFMVQGTGFRCMAYCDQDGKWRDAFNNDELFGAVTILE